MSAPTAELSEDRLVGTTIQDRFLIRERIAAGGMGVVYEAEQIPLGRRVALKVLESRHNEAMDAHFGERFFLEAAAVAKLGHPNTIVLYDYGRSDTGLYYYAMEFVEGCTLTQYVHRHGPLSPRDAIHVALQLAGSLREAHHSGLVHRDVKTGNVMITSKGGDPLYVKVLDFGLVKVMGQETPSDLTRSGALLGSPRYMAPEQVTNISVDHRADIYSFGAVIYHALTGGPPFRQAGQYEVLRAQVEETPRSTRDAFPAGEIPETLDQIVMQCLAKDASERPQTMNQVAVELAKCAKELGLAELALNSACLPVPDSVDSKLSSAPPPVFPRDPHKSSAPPPVLTPEAITPSPPQASLRELPTVAAKASAFSADSTRPEGAATRNRRRLIVALLAGIAMVAGLVGFLLTRPESGPPSAEEPPAQRASEAAEVATEPGIEAETEDEIASPVEPASEEAQPTALNAPVRVATIPSGATVLHGSERLGQTPLTLQVPLDAPWELTLSRAGFHTETVTAHGDQDEVTVELRSSRGASRARGTGLRRVRPAPSETPADEGSAPPAEPADSSRSGSEGRDWGRVRQSDNRDPWAQ